MSDLSKTSYEAFESSPEYSRKWVNYFPVYDELFSKFKGCPVTFIEIGVLHGGSLFMWREFLGEKARIIGVDLNPEALKWNSFGFEIYIGDQENSQFWNDFYKQVGQFDILLDDGGHTNSQQIQTVRCALPYARSESVIVVEDTQTSFLADFGNPSGGSVVEYVKGLVDSIARRNPEIPEKELEISKNIHSLQFFESILAIHTRDDLCVENQEIENSGQIGNASDFRYVNDAIFEQNLRLIIKKFAFRFESNSFSSKSKLAPPLDLDIQSFSPRGPRSFHNDSKKIFAQEASENFRGLIGKRKNVMASIWVEPIYKPGATL
jgi:hypothetical protein